MKRKVKTKEQLIQELALLRQRISDLEALKVPGKRAKKKPRESAIDIEPRLKALAENGLKPRAQLLDNTTDFIDITEQKKMEVELLLRSQLLDNATDFIFLRELNGKIVYANEMAYESYGYSKEEIMSMDIRQLLLPDDANLVESRTQMQLEKGKITFESTHVCKDGSMLPMEVHSRVIEAGGEQFILGVCRNITARKKAEREIFRKNMLLESINRIFRKAIACNTEGQLAKTCLTVCQELTGSKFGFIGELNKAERLDIIDFSDPAWFASQIPKSEASIMIRDVEVRGYWGRVLKQGVSQIVNDPESEPDRQGTPQGHPPINSFLGVPLKKDGKIFGIIALANKEGGYSHQDQETIESLSGAIVEVLMHKRAELRAKKLFSLQSAIREINEAWLPRRGRPRL